MSFPLHLDRQGNLQLVLNKSNGLPDNLVYQVYTDREGGLWGAFNKGLARIEISNPLSRHFLAPALQSGVLDIARHQGELYAATAEGLLVMAAGASPGSPPEFRAVSGLKLFTSTMSSVGKDLLLTSHEGIYQIENQQARLIGQPAGQMLRSMRLQHAADLLVKNAGTIAEIGFATGFSDQAIFTRNFKKQFGCSPSAYRKTHLDSSPT